MPMLSVTIQPVRLVLSDTETGENYWHDGDYEFSLTGVIGALNRAIEDGYELAPLSWHLTDRGTTAVWAAIDRRGTIFHGVAYTRFVRGYAIPGYHQLT